MKNSYKLASITMLCSLLLLSACHKNETKSDSNDHSTVKTAQSSSKKAKSSKAKKKMTANASSNKKVLSRAVPKRSGRERPHLYAVRTCPQQL